MGMPLTSMDGKDAVGTSCQRYVGGPQREITYSLTRFCSWPPTPITCSGISLSKFSYIQNDDYAVRHKEIGALLEGKGTNSATICPRFNEHDGGFCVGRLHRKV